MSFDVHPERVQELAQLVGLEHPVVVRKTRYQRGFGGRYTDFRNGQHRISLESRLDPSRALSILLHEMGHALQCERLGCDRKAFDSQWFGEMRAAGVKLPFKAGEIDWDAYNSTPMEREANALADEWMAKAESLVGAITLTEAELERLYAAA